MTQKISPFIEANYGWALGESGWNLGADENWLQFSYLFDSNIDGVVSTLPSAVNGTAYYLTTDNRVYFAVGNTYYSTAVPKWFQVKLRSDGTLYQFNGTSLIQIPSNSSLSARVSSVETITSTLGTAAFQPSSVFTNTADLANTTDSTKGVSLVGGAMRSVDSLAGLKALSVNGSKIVYRKGYLTSGDGGAGHYYFDSTSVATANDITIIAPTTGTGRWIYISPGFINAKIAGATQGRGDNQVPINACIAIAASTGGGRVYLPAGTYTLSGPITVAGAGVTLSGDGRQATQLYQNQLNANIITVTGDFFNLSDLGMFYTGTPTAGAVLNITGGSANCRDFVIRSAWNGIEVSGPVAVACKFDNFDITNYEQSAFYMHESADCFISNFLMNAGDTTRGRLGAIRLYNKVEAFIAERGDILLGVYSLVCDAAVNTSGLRPAFNKFTDVYFDSSGFGCLLDKTVETDFNNCWFSGGKPQPYPTGGANPGITLSATNNISITGGQAYNCGSDGVSISAAARGTMISGGFRVSSNSTTTTTPGVGNGIRLADGAQQFSICGLLANNGLGPGTQGYGIFLGTGCSNFTISECVLIGNLTGAIGGDITGAAGRIAGNVGFITFNKGSSTIPVGQSVVTITHGMPVAPAVHDIQVAFGDSNAGRGATALYPTSINATTFQIAANAVVTTSALPVTWRVGVKGN